MTTRITLFRAALVLMLALSATAAWAHHSQSQYEPEKTISVEGTLKQASWGNPHTLFVIVGKPAGTTEAPQESAPTRAVAWTVVMRPGAESATSKVHACVRFVTLRL